MPLKQTNLFKPTKIPQLTEDEKEYKWLSKNGFAGYNGKYNLYSKSQLYQMIQWNMLYGNDSAEEKEYLLTLMTQIKKSRHLYYHVKSFSNILGYSKWILSQIYKTEQNRIKKNK